MANAATVKDLQAALGFLTLGDRALPANLSKPKVGIVCGSGLGGLVDIIRNKVEFAYTDIPGFVNSTGKGFFLRLNAKERFQLSKRTTLFFGVAFARIHYLRL